MFWIYKQTKVLTVGFMAPLAWTPGPRLRLHAIYVHTFVFHACVAIVRRDLARGRTAVQVVLPKPR